MVRATAIAILAGAAVACAGCSSSAGPTSGGVAGRYLSAWQRGNVTAMRDVSVNVPRGGLAAPIEQVDRDLGVRGRTLRLGRVTSGPRGTARAAFTAVTTLAGGTRWTYQGQLNLVWLAGRWRVNWSPAAIYPRLRARERFRVSAVWPQRAPILAADGSRLDSPQAVAASGSVQMLTGVLGPATAAQAKALGAPYRQGDVVGQSGIARTYERRLAGTPRTSIQLVNGQGQAVATAASLGGQPGTPVRTSIEMRVQDAASRAVAAVSGHNVAMVAIRPSTGDVLAVVNKPGGFNRALLGTYPPGPTFKMITAAALVLAGMRPSDAVPCPSTIDVGGRRFHNFDFEQFGTTSLLNAFAVSCTTTFAELAASRLTGSKLGAMADQFGFGAAPDLGLPAVLGSFTPPADSTALAADGFGQGTDLANPLEMATVAGAIEDGVWHSPRLVTNPAPTGQVAHPLSPAITSALRPMMAAVVSVGTAARVGFPPGVFGKTGTAEFGSGKNPPTHAWFAGYRGDLAFAVIVEDGGVGADESGPVANAFLRGL
jgi:Penicillin binding protein transpeptidase domain/NTF2-like N-terminal transpeptidase domain/Penicillin-binding Protein dimerisation domain